MLADVFSVSIQIVKPDGTDAVAKTALGMADAPAGTRVGIGHHAYAWTPGSNGVGLYTVRWYYVVASGDAEASFDLPFELVAVPYPPGPQYCTVESLAAEGFPASFSAAQTQTAIVRASRYVEHFTGRTFVPVRKVLRVDGTSSRALMLDEPIVAMEDVQIADPLGGIVIIDNTMQIYNRHIREGLLNPDDRDNPKLEFLHGNDLAGVNEDASHAARNFLVDCTWPRGRQNVYLTGVFGYTEPDGSFVGGTPMLIQEATRMLIFKNLKKMSLRVGVPSTAVIQETTKDQTVIFAQPGAGGDNRARMFTGDPDIDMLLLGFIRPPHFGAA